MTHFRNFAASVALSTLTLPAVAIADEPAVPAPQKSERASPLMSAKELTQMRGGQQIAINNQTLNSQNTGNVIDGDFTAGDVTLSDDALSNFNGLGNFIFNTGAQSSLQAGMSVTINVNE